MLPPLEAMVRGVDVVMGKRHETQHLMKLCAKRATNTKIIVLSNGRGSVREDTENCLADTYLCRPK